MQAPEEHRVVGAVDDCEAKAVYCAWAAQQTADPGWRNYLEDLARSWSLLAIMLQSVSAETGELQ